MTPPIDPRLRQIEAMVSALDHCARRIDTYYPKPSDVVGDPVPGTAGFLLDQTTVAEKERKASADWSAEHQRREASLREMRLEIRQALNDLPLVPEHHAVYDTRLMVAVPVAELERIDNVLHELLDISAGLHSAVMHDGDTDHREHWINEFDTKHDGFHAVWERVFDLLPKEATDEA